MRLAALVFLLAACETEPAPEPVDELATSEVLPADALAPPFRRNCPRGGTEVSSEVLHVDFGFQRPLGRDRLIRTQVDYDRLRGTVHAFLPDVDFTTSVVAVVDDYRSSTCGLGFDTLRAVSSAAGRVQVQARLIDESYGCCVVCDALGRVRVIARIDATAPMSVCREYAGGCYGSPGDTGYCGP